MCKGKHPLQLAIFLFNIAISTFFTAKSVKLYYGRLGSISQNNLNGTLFIHNNLHSDKNVCKLSGTRIVVDKSPVNEESSASRAKLIPKKSLRRPQNPKTIFPQSPYCGWDEYTTQEDVWAGSIPTLGTDYTKTLTQHGFERYLAEDGGDPIGPCNIPLPGVIRNRDAARRAQSLLPPSQLKNFYKCPDSVKKKLLDPTFQGYHSVLNNRNFHQFQPEFYYKLVDGEIKKNEWDYPSVPDPPDRPELERDKIIPTVPLGWRTFCIIALHIQGEDCERWYARQFRDLPRGRLASGLFCAGEALKFIHTREVIDEHGHLIHSELPIQVDERFDGQPGELPELDFNSNSIFSDPSANGFSDYETSWPRRPLEGIITTLSPSQISWARLSTTLVNASAKMLQLYRIQLEVPSPQSVSVSNTNGRCNEDVMKSVSVGVMYTLAAPTYHHALQFATSDPFAKARLYSQMHLYELLDETNSHFLLGKELTDQAFRQYLVFAKKKRANERAGQAQNSEFLYDVTTRFLVRSNCVNARYSVFRPFLDSPDNLNREYIQLLPITDKQKLVLSQTRHVPEPSMSNSKNRDFITEEMYMICGMDVKEAYEWANRLPMCRAGLYDSLFVSRVEEIGFYPQNAVLSAPVPTPPSMLPMAPEYVRISVDPIEEFIKRSSRIGAAFTPPRKAVSACTGGLDRVDKTGEGEFDRVDKTGKGGFVKLTGKPPKKYTLQNCSIIKSVRADVVNDYAPTDLDRPFYIDYLQQFYFIQAPRGRYFFQPKPFSGANQAGTSAYQLTGFSASDMCHMPQYRPVACPGIWVLKSKVGSVLSNSKQGILQWYSEKIDRAKVLIHGGLVEDEVRRGSHLQCDFFYPPFMRCPKALRTNVSPYDLLYGVFALWNRGIEFYARNREDELPPLLSCLSYLNEGNSLLQNHPDAAYDVQLDFLERYERGLVGMNEEPLGIMASIKDERGGRKPNTPEVSFQLWGDDSTLTQFWPDDNLPFCIR